MVTLFDAIGLYFALKSTQLICKTKKGLLGLDAIYTGLFILSYILFVDKTAYTDMNSSFIALFGLLVLVDIFYMFFKPNNKSFVILSTFLLFLLAWSSTNTFVHWEFLTLSIPMISHLLGCDCSDLKGYSTLNTLEALGWIIFSFAVMNWFCIVISLVYLVSSCFLYLRENKLDALTNKKKSGAESEQVIKENREARRARERQERRGRKK